MTLVVISYVEVVHIYSFLESFNENDVHQKQKLEVFLSVEDSVRVLDLAAQEDALEILIEKDYVTCKEEVNIKMLVNLQENVMEIDSSIVIIIHNNRIGREIILMIVITSTA